MHGYCLGKKNITNLNRHPNFRGDEGVSYEISTKSKLWRTFDKKITILVTTLLSFINSPIITVCFVNAQWLLLILNYLDKSKKRLCHQEIINWLLSSPSLPLSSKISSPHCLLIVCLWAVPYINCYYIPQLVKLNRQPTLLELFAFCCVQQIQKWVRNKFRQIFMYSPLSSSVTITSTHSSNTQGNTLLSQQNKLKLR